MLEYGFITLPRNISKAMLFGIILSGLISGLVPENYFADQTTNLWLAMLLMLVIGTPLYVCSTASVPIALSFIKAGIPLGAVLVFLITGPATNAAALTTLWKLIGKKQLAVFLLALSVTAIGAGLLLNQFPIYTDASVYACHDAAQSAGWFEWLSTIFLVLVLANGIRPLREKGSAL